MKLFVVAVMSLGISHLHSFQKARQWKRPGRKERVHAQMQPFLLRRNDTDPYVSRIECVTPRGVPSCRAGSTPAPGASQRMAGSLDAPPARRGAVGIQRLKDAGILHP